MTKSPKSDPERHNGADERSPQETERIREQTLKRILRTPPKRHSDMIAERKGKQGRKPNKRGGP
jgi:hypothetical protein